MPYPDAFETYRNSEPRVQKWVGHFTRAIQDPAEKVLLDCGCGVGRFTVPLSGLFMHSFGVDKDSAMLDVARRKSSGVTWLQANVSEIPLADHSVDVILASMLIEHLDELDDFLCEANRLTREGGTLLIRTMLPGDIEKTTWYSFSENVRRMELNRTRSLEILNECFFDHGFTLCQDRSLFHEVERFPDSDIVARLASRCYEILYHLSQRDFDECMRAAEQWEATGTKDEMMSSSLLVYRKRSLVK